MESEVESNLFNETVRIFNGAVALGFADAVQAGAPIPDTEFQKALAENVEVFSAFRTHRMQNDIARLMTDERGVLKSFSRFARDVQPYVSHRNRAWLRTEYSTAVLRAAQASEWKQFEAEKDVLPNLRWVPSTSPDPGADHRVFWNTVRPIGDRFWSQHRPGDRWNCKCGLEPTDEPATAVPSASGKRDEPSPGLENNPGKDGKIFSRKHPYFPKSCAACPFNSQPKLFALFADLTDRKDCEKCRAFIRLMERAKDSDNQIVPPHHEEYKEVKPGVFVHPMHGDGEEKENVRIASIIAKKTNEKIWLLPNINSKTLEQINERKRLLPDSIKDGKNPDFLIKGKFYECKSMTNIRHFDRIHIKNTVENHIKKAKKQADNIILEIPKDVKYQYVEETITNYLNRTKNIKEIRIIWNGYLKIKKAPDK